MPIIPSLYNYYTAVIIYFRERILYSLRSTLLRTLRRRLFNNDYTHCSLCDILGIFFFNLLRKLVKSYTD
jgi:hypothetical protein